MRWRCAAGASACSFLPIHPSEGRASGGGWFARRAVYNSIVQRVAYVIWSLGLGGAEQVVIRLAAALDRSRFEPFVCCLNEPGKFAPQAERAGIEVLAFHKRHAVDPPVVARLADTFRRRSVDVVHTHLWGANLWGRIAARLARVGRVVITEHSLDDWKRGHHFFIDRRLASSAHELIAVSQQVRDFYERHSVGLGRWRVIYNGVDTTRPVARGRGESYRALGIPEDSPVVGMLGRIVAAKAPEVFLEAIAIAARRVPALRALVIGDGPLRGDAEKHSRRLGIAERTLFTGVREDVPELLAGMDVLAFSSTREGLSIAMLEAMAAGVPVVATNVGGNPELIESGVSGELVPVGDAQALATNIVEIVLDKRRSERLRANARRRVEDHFSLATMAASHEALYCGESAPTRVVR